MDLSGPLCICTFYVFMKFSIESSCILTVRVMNNRLSGKRDLSRPMNETILTKMAVFWVVAQCRSCVPTFHKFLLPPSSGRWVYHECITHRPDVAGGRYLWNVAKLLPVHTVLQPRRHPTSYSPPWGLKILLRRFQVCVTSELVWWAETFQGRWGDM
jgi:hypothetical protein